MSPFSLSFRQSSFHQYQKILHLVFYVQGSKLSFAVYHTSVQGKSSGLFQTLCKYDLIFEEKKDYSCWKFRSKQIVPPLADLLNQLSYLLLHLQQLRDKVSRSLFFLRGGKLMRIFLSFSLSIFDEYQNGLRLEINGKQREGT